MKVGMFFFKDNKIFRWLNQLGIDITSDRWHVDYYTEGDIDIRFIHLLRILYNNGHVSNIRYAPKNVVGIYVRWEDWL